jgi:beta-ribofuranosylaminobenzene 5'-phosphate synthase
MPEASRDVPNWQPHGISCRIDDSTAIEAGIWQIGRGSGGGENGVMDRMGTITTGSRLHFGPLAWKPRHGRDFGGWGVMIETPRTVVRVGRFDDSRQPGRQECSSQRRAEGLLQQLRKQSPFAIPEAVRVFVDEEPPQHCGYGSGTQLALAIARGVTQGVTGGFPGGADLARLVGRGLRSAVGIYGFDQGGLIVDAGKRPEDVVGQLAARVDFPAEWRFVLVRPGAVHGLTGDTEAAAFRKLPAFNDALTDRLSRIVLSEILPAAQDRRCDHFAAALQEYGMLVGEAFHACQGGVVHPASMPLWTALCDRGVRGVAQTSWGPTLAIVCGGEDKARELAAMIRQIDEANVVTISAARNKGVEVICV